MLQDGSSEIVGETVKMTDKEVKKIKDHFWKLPQHSWGYMILARIQSRDYTKHFSEMNFYG